MDPDKIRKMAAVTVALPVVITGIGLMLGLSGWRIVIAAIIIPASILAVWLKPSFLQLQQPNQNQPSRLSRLLNWAKKDPLSAFVFSIALLVIVYGVFSYWQDNIAGPGKELGFSSQEEFQQKWRVLSGNCQVINEYLSGECEIALKDSENLGWWKIKVVPPDFNDPGGPAEIKEVSITAKEFTFKHFVGVSAYGWEGTKNLLFHQGKAYYYSKQDNKNYLISGGNMEKQKEGDLPLPFTVTKSKSGFPAGNFQLFIGEKLIANAYYPSGVGYLEGGPIRIQISKGTKIKQVEIY